MQKIEKNSRRHSQCMTKIRMVELVERNSKKCFVICKEIYIFHLIYFLFVIVMIVMIVVVIVNL